MKQNISELAETIYRLKQQSDTIINMHFARVFKKAILNEQKFYVPIHRESRKKINPLIRQIDDKKYLIVFSDFAFVRIFENSDAITMKMPQILQILEHDEDIYGISLNTFHKEYSVEINRRNFSNIWKFQV